MTAAMVVSSVVLQVGLRAIRRGRTGPFTRMLGITLGLGLVFIVLQIVGFSSLAFGIRDGGAYGSLFYVMTSLHMAHVFGGVLFLSLVLAQSRTGQLSMVRHEPVEAGAIYWHFVDVVWIGLFTVFYLIVR